VSVQERFRQTYDYAEAHGFPGGFPNFHQADYGDGVVYGTLLLSTATWRDVLAADFGNPAGGDIGARFRATNDYARRQGFAAGFPNFHQANYGQGLVYGTILVKNGAVQWRDVPMDIMNMFSWPFNVQITRGQRLRVLERHSFAYTRIRACGDLSNDERNNLLSAYRRIITHGINTDPTANASATVNGSQIDINFGNLFPLGNREIAQTLIHEMMHCAGYTHPNRIDPPSPNADVPGDNGPYYGTPPLRSERCIAGMQSLISEDKGSLCSEVNGKYTIQAES